MNSILESLIIAVAGTFLGSSITNTKPGFIECLPKWNDSKLEQPEHCKPVKEDGKKDNSDNSLAD